MSITFSNKWCKRLLILIVVAIAVEACLELTVLSFNGGSPGQESGILLITEIPETDIEFVETSIHALQEVSWWQDAPQLIGLRHRFDCSRVQQPPYQSLLDFRRVARITLLAESVNYATMKFMEEGAELHYLLEDYGIYRVRPHTAINLDEIMVTSKEAVQQAERNGGEALRTLIDDKCYISVAFSRGGVWVVDYIQTDPFKRLLCFNVDVKTGEIRQVAERSFTPCPE